MRQRHCVPSIEKDIEWGRVCARRPRYTAIQTEVSVVTHVSSSSHTHVDKACASAAVKTSASSVSAPVSLNHRTPYGGPFAVSSSRKTRCSRCALYLFSNALTARPSGTGSCVVHVRMICRIMLESNSGRWSSAAWAAADTDAVSSPGAGA